MKTTKLVGAVALTAALAMGTMPAFAVSTSTAVPSDWQSDLDFGIQDGASVSNKSDAMVVNTAANNKKTGTGSTAVMATVFDSDLNVTVPVQIAVAFPTKGGSLTCPTAGAYKILNNGDKKVSLDNIAGAGIGSWNLKTVASINTSNAGAGTTGTAGYDIGLELTIPGMTTKQDLKTLSDVTSGKNINGVTIPAKTGTTAGSLGIDMNGMTNVFATPISTAGYVASQIASITYTVSVDTTS